MTAFEEFRQLVELAKQRGWITPPPIRPRQGVTTRTPEEQKAWRKIYNKAFDIKRRALAKQST